MRRTPHLSQSWTCSMCRACTPPPGRRWPPGPRSLGCSNVNTCMYTCLYSYTLTLYTYTQIFCLSHFETCSNPPITLQAKTRRKAKKIGQPSLLWPDLRTASTHSNWSQAAASRSNRLPQEKHLRPPCRPRRPSLPSDPPSNGNTKFFGFLGQYQ